MYIHITIVKENAEGPGRDLRDSSEQLLLSCISRIAKTVNNKRLRKLITSGSWDLRVSSPTV